MDDRALMGLPGLARYLDRRPELHAKREGRRFPLEAQSSVKSVERPVSPRAPVAQVDRAAVS